MTQNEVSGIDLLAFAHPILINLADRPQRLADSLAELSAATGRTVEAGRDVHLIRPVRFDDPGGFVNAGFRSNTDAHLQAAEWARDGGFERVLVLEDDLAFNPAWAGQANRMLAHLATRPWHLANLGYLDEWGEAPTVADLDAGPAQDPTIDPVARCGWVRFSGKVNGAHAYLLHGSILDLWIEHLRTVLDGTTGDELRGPMASDGAINTFFWIDPERIRLVAVPNMVGTRPTRSDIDPGLIDRLPLLGAGAEVLRRWYRGRRRGSAINYR